MRELRRLSEQGLLVREYPRLARLLTGLSAAELAKAGHLLSRLDAAEVQGAHPAVPAVTIAVTGHGTLAALGPALVAELARHGLLARLHLTDFDSYVFELGDPASGLYQAKPDLVLCVLDQAIVTDELRVPWTVPDVALLLDAKLRALDRLATTFEATCAATLVLNTIPLLRGLTAQLIDYRSRAQLGAAWRDANARLLRLADEHPAVVVLDLEPLMTDGVPVSDIRLSTYAKAHLSADLLGRYAREVGHLARGLAGLAKKTLVVDLDNTIWGGVLGDDGPDGIEVADGYRGQAFTSFQRVLKQIGAQGVLLAAASKNDAEAVRQVLGDHPGMTLREDDFVRISASWRPKHEGIAELADALNLKTDSFVFVDDSPYECGLVRDKMPEVTVIGLDDEPAWHVTRLLGEGWFDIRQITRDDRERVARYRDDLVRKDFLDGFDSIEDYLRELRIRVRLAEVASADAARVAQLTMRTNQFNLTTRRMQPAEVVALATDPRAAGYAIHASDRFGDNGLVGAVFTRTDGDVVRIENFLLSCRVFARGIEQACLASILRFARVTGARSVVASYRPSAKNGKVADFYPRFGFTLADDSGADDDAVVTFRHDLADVIAVPSHIQMDEAPSAGSEVEP